MLGITGPSLSGAKTPHFCILFYDTGAAKRAFRKASKVGEVAVFRVGYAASPTRARLSRRRSTSSGLGNFAAHNVDGAA